MTKLLNWIIGGIVFMGVLCLLLLFNGKFNLLPIISIPFVVIVSSLSIASVIYRFKNRVILQFKEKHYLEVLEDVNGDVYAIKKKTGGEPIYIFSILDENGKKSIIVDKEIIVVKKDVERPYLKVYYNVYKPKGFLDKLFYTDNDPNNKFVIYKIYLPDDIIIR